MGKVERSFAKGKKIFVLPPCEGGRPSQGGGYRDEDIEENMVQWLSSTEYYQHLGTRNFVTLSYFGPITDKIPNISARKASSEV